MTLRLPGLTLEELTAELGSRARAVALLRWLDAQRQLPRLLPGQVEGIARRAWHTFRERCEMVKAELAEVVTGPDGTTKAVVELEGAKVESVLIPARGRGTVCISSQAGCTRRCVFCATQQLGFGRHLTAAEMVAQFMLSRGSGVGTEPARNVVFMGMGEPLDNLDEVLRAVAVLTQSPAPQLRAEAVTVSTSGVVPGMRRFLSECKASLAVSLNATTDAVRSRLMPHNRTWPIAEVLEVLRQAAVSSPRRVTFVEYVLFQGVNDSDDDASRLVELLRGLPARVNLIPWNPAPRVGLASPSRQRVEEFHARVAAAGQRCMVRWPRGREIAAACGQLVLADARARVSPEGTS